MKTLSALLMFLTGTFTVMANPLPIPAVWGVDPTTSGGELVYVDAFVPHVIARYPLPNIHPVDTRIALTGDAHDTLYYLNGDNDPQHLHLFSVNNGSSLGDIQIDGNVILHGLGLVSDRLFGADDGSNNLIAYPATGGPALGPWSNIYDPKAVAGDTGNRLFVYGDTTINGRPQGRYAIYEVDPANPSAPAQFFSPAPSDTIVGLANDFDFLYVSDTEGHLFVMDESSGKLLNTVDFGFTLYGLGTTRVQFPDSGSTVILFLVALGVLVIPSRENRFNPRHTHSS